MNLRQQVARALALHIAPGATVCLGLSGGMDSMVLLDIMAKLAPGKGWRLRALHVNHQLSEHAAAWASFCGRECRARKVPLSVVKVTVARGNSTEAAARAARYAAFRATGADHLVLAHHQDDQVETLLLRLLRGAGAKGLAAMAPARRESGAARMGVLRPLLATPRARIEDYATRHVLHWVTDDSNADTRYLRNHLRLKVLPQIERLVPAYRDTLTRAAANLAESAELLDDLARIDAGGELVDGVLPFTALTSLTPARRANLLRFFLHERGVSMPDRRVLEDILRQLHAPRPDSRMSIEIGQYLLRAYSGCLHVVPNRPLPPKGYTQQWRGERELALPALGGLLRMTRRRGAGIALACLKEYAVEVRTRAGGERLQLDARRPRRRVKDLLQEYGVPPWQRECLPFLWCGGKLAWVAGLGVDMPFQAPPGKAGVLPQWVLPDDEAH